MRNKMNISRERWAKFKQELNSIIVVSIFQIWWNFNFPAFMRLDDSMRFILGISMSVISTFVFIYVFSSADKYAPYYNLEGFNEGPEEYRDIFKNIYRIGLIALTHIVIFYIWHNNIYGMSNLYYAILYAHCLISRVLIAKAINRPKDTNTIIQ
jgi:hypothetical protein